MNDSNSRILDALYQQNIINEEEIANRIEAIKMQVITAIGEHNGQQLVNNAKHQELLQCTFQRFERGDGEGVGQKLLRRKIPNCHRDT